MCNTTNENNEELCDEPISGNMNETVIDMEPINEEDFASFVKTNLEYCENADLTLGNNDRKRKLEFSYVENQSKFMKKDMECFENIEDLMKEDEFSNDNIKTQVMTINTDDNTTNKFHKCEHCKSTFSNLVTLKVHINNQHVAIFQPTMAIVQHTGILFLNSVSSHQEKSFQISPCDISQKSCSNEEESVDSEGFKKPIEMPSYKKPLSVAQVCNDYDLLDFPLRVTKFNQAHFRHKPNFDRFVYPVLKVLNPEAQYFTRKNLAEAKWYQIMNYKQTKRS